MGAALCGPSRAHAATPDSYRIRASIHRESGEVEGTLWVRVRVAEDESDIVLWLYPERQRDTPSAMDERSARWIYPGEVDRAGIEVDRVVVDGRPVETTLVTHPSGEPRGRDAAGSDLRVAIAEGPARVVTLRLHFRLRAAGRFGRFGRIGGHLSLAAPWYPLVIGEGDAFDHRVPHRVRLELDNGELLVGAGRFGREAEVELTGAYVPVVALPAVHERVVRASGVSVVLRTPNELARFAPPEVHGWDGLRDLAAVDVPGLIQREAEAVIDSARAFGVPVPARIVIETVPSRTELVATAPGVVLMSDHLFQIFPIDQTLDFHRSALRRALLQHLMEPLAVTDAAADRGWATDLRAVCMFDLDLARRSAGVETPQSLLSLLSFHPAVDQLLYAPQIAFEDAYFASIEERDVFRDDPVRARRPLSRGRRILEMGRDALDEESFHRWVAMLVNAQRPARAALERASAPRASRLESWLAATGAPVNYRLGATRSERLDDGRYRHVVEVFRDGEPRAEPVEVRVDDSTGASQVAIWDAPGARGEVSVTMRGTLAGVTIDPRHRLPQSPVLADGHPRMDDATDLPWRPPILNGFLFNVFVTEGDFTGLIDFALRRRYDLEHTIGLRAERTRAFTGGTLSYRQGIGPKVHTNRRMASLTGAISFDRLHEFFGDGDLGGWRLQGSVGASLNTVRFQPDPREGYWGSVGLTGGVAFRDDGTVGGTARGGLRLGGIWPLGLLNAIAVVIGGGFTAGDALLSELQTLGGADRLRGFESGEHLGHGAIYGVVEHRWTILSDLSLNLAQLVWVREVQLAFFAGGGAVFGTVDGQDAVGAADVGGGLRIHFEYGGVQPGVIGIDVGVPLTRTTDGVFVDGMLVRRRAPVGFYIGFDQFF